MAKNIDINYLYQIYKDEGGELSKSDFVESVESKIEDMIREGELE